MSEHEALEWVVDFLDSENIPYLICGGLAAMAYGSKRALNDIDLFVPESMYQAVVRFGQAFITYGPERLHDAHWNIDYVQFTYKGQMIEVGSNKDIQIFDAISQKWHPITLDFNDYNNILLFGKTVRVMTKETLIDYKSKLNREVDKIDIENKKCIISHSSSFAVAHKMP